MCSPFEDGIVNGTGFYRFNIRFFSRSCSRYNPKAGKTDIDLVDPAATRSSMAAEMVRDVPLLLFSMDILSAGQCAVRNGSAFIPDEAVAGDGSTSNADRRICDFYDSAGGWQRGCVFGTGGSNDSASMVHIRRD